MRAQSVKLKGETYVIIPRDEFDRLSRLANLPPLPEPDADGNYPAVEYARASLARKLILRRQALGWSQRELAKRSGVRFETICRIETGKNTPNIATVEKIDAALSEAESPKNGRSRKAN